MVRFARVREFFRRCLCGIEQLVIHFSVRFRA